MAEDAPCGIDLEYDNDFLALNQAAAGKPESQFAPAEPPDWRAVAAQAEALLERTRDLRVAVLWLRSQVSLRGYAALPEGLALLGAMLETFWDSLHPLPDPDDQDPFARLNALAVLREPEGLLGELRQALIAQVRGVGELRVRTIEVAWGQLAPRADETPLAREAVTRMLADAMAQSPELATLPDDAVAAARALTNTLNERFGFDAAPDLAPLQSLLQLVAGAMPVPEAEAGVAEGDVGRDASEGAPPGGRARLSGDIHTREDALRAIDLVCDYLERTEPTNPAQLLLRRARRMINHNFLQLMKELAPEALSEVARVMGVDPDSVQIEASE